MKFIKLTKGCGFFAASAVLLSGCQTIVAADAETLFELPTYSAVPRAIHWSADLPGAPNRDEISITKYGYHGSGSTIEFTEDRRERISTGNGSAGGRRSFKIFDTIALLLYGSRQNESTNEFHSSTTSNGKAWFETWLRSDLVDATTINSIDAEFSIRSLRNGAHPYARANAPHPGDLSYSRTNTRISLRGVGGSESDTFPGYGPFPEQGRSLLELEFLDVGSQCIRIDVHAAGQTRTISAPVNSAIGYSVNVTTDRISITANGEDMREVEITTLPSAAATACIDGGTQSLINFQFSQPGDVSSGTIRDWAMRGDDQGWFALALRPALHVYQLSYDSAGGEILPSRFDVDAPDEIVFDGVEIIINE